MLLVHHSEVVTSKFRPVKSRRRHLEVVSLQELIPTYKSKFNVLLTQSRVHYLCSSPLTVIFITCLIRQNAFPIWRLFALHSPLERLTRSRRHLHTVPMLATPYMLSVSEHVCVKRMWRSSLHLRLSRRLSTHLSLTQSLARGIDLASYPWTRVVHVCFLTLTTCSKPPRRHSSDLYPPLR